MDLITELEQFIRTELVSDGETGALSPDDDLLEEGILDSVGIVELIGHLEQRFGLHVSDDELIPENFRTIADLARFVQAKTEARS